MMNHIILTDTLISNEHQHSMTTGNMQRHQDLLIDKQPIQQNTRSSIVPSGCFFMEYFISSFILWL